MSGEPTAAPRDRVTRVAAYGLAVSAGQILLCRLSDRTTEPGSWTLPGGGVDHGEHPRAAVARELYEETGLHVVVGALLEVDSLHLAAGETASGASLHAIRIVYRIEADTTRVPRVLEQAGSTDAAGWFVLDEAERLPLLSLARLGVALARSGA